MQYINGEKLPKLGLCTIGKFVFSHEAAKRVKAELETKLKSLNVPFTGIDTVVTDGIVRNLDDAEAAIKYLKAQQVDAVFMPHGNFGTENAVGMIGKELGVPVLIWGSRDDAPLPDGTRERDTLCGLFASTKVLYKLRVPYTYLENCRICDPQFEQGIDTFLRAAAVAKGFRKGMKIGHLGQRIDFFWTTIINENELLDRFNIRIQPLDLVDFIRDIKTMAADNRKVYAGELAELKQSATLDGFEDEAVMHYVFALRDRMLELGEEHNFDAFAIQDFMSLITETGVYDNYGVGQVSEKYPVGMESDIHGAISGLMLKRAALDATPSFLTEFTVRHFDDDNGVLLWHASPPPSMKHPDAKIRLGRHWIIKTGKISGATHFRLKDGEITLTRFDGDHGEYKLAVGHGKTMDGPKTENNYVWFKADNWPRWEHILMHGPFIHHTAMAYGNYTDALIESCRYIPGLEPVILNQ